LEKIKIRKETVLEILRENKAKHCIEFEEAISGWISKARIKLTDLLSDLNTDKARSLKIEIYLPRPVSYEKDYEKAIKMIEFEIRDEVEISTQDFDKYFLDEWTWKENFLSNTGLYKNH
jgi:hypothetical protein